MLEVIHLLAAAIRFRPPGGAFSFLWDRNNPRSRLGSMGFSFYLDRDQLERAAIILLNIEANRLGGMTVGDAKRVLLDFFQFHLEVFGGGSLMWGPRSGLTCLAEAADVDYDSAAAALHAYIEEISAPKIYLLPARRLSLEESSVGQRVLLLQATPDMHQLLPKGSTSTSGA